MRIEYASAMTYHCDDDGNGHNCTDTTAPRENRQRYSPALMERALTLTALTLEEKKQKMRTIGESISH